MNDQKYFVIYSYMIHQLGLKGAERDVYAIITGFSKNNGCYYGGIKTLSDISGYAERNIGEALKKLIKKGLLLKEGRSYKALFIKSDDTSEKSDDTSYFETELEIEKSDATSEKSDATSKKSDATSDNNKYNKEKKKEDVPSSVNLPPNSPSTEQKKSEEKTEPENTPQSMPETLPENPPPSEPKERNYDTHPFTVKEFGEMWNKWIDKYQLDVQHVRAEKATQNRRKKFKLRQKRFAKDGANTRGFWESILYCVHHARNGFYVTEEDEKDWTITFDWLIKSDDTIVKFMEAER